MCIKHKYCEVITINPFDQLREGEERGEEACSNRPGLQKADRKLGNVEGECKCNVRLESSLCVDPRKCTCMIRRRRVNYLFGFARSPEVNL
jgi:hypothetical protein